MPSEFRLPVSGDSSFSRGTDAPLVDGIVITGRVVDVQQQSSFQTTLGKVVALVFDGQPWQFGRQVLKTTIFVEAGNVYSDGNSSNQQRGMVFYGDINVAVRPGHMIQATVRQKRGQLYVKRLNNLTTNSRVIATGQISRWVTVFVMLVVLGVPLFLLAALLEAFANGSLINGIGNLLVGALGVFGPLIIMGVCIYWLLKSLIK